MPAGVLLHTELELMVNAGLTPLETLADATSVPAKIFSLMDRGRISAGLRADLLLVRGDPTRDVRATRDIVAIWKQGVHIDRDRFREAVAQENEAWQFGAGWMPLPASGSSVRISTITGGPNHARATMIISGEAKSEKMSTSVGAEYFPSLSYPMANEDVSGRPQVSFWTRGDGKTYRIALLQRGRTPSTRSFVASKEWTQIVIPFSDFGNDGSRVALVQISSSTRGPLHIELADALVGARRWLGIELAGGQEGVRVDSVNTNSPAQRAGMRAGDVITDFNGRRVHNYKDVLNLLSETRIGDKVRLDIERDDKRQTVVIEVAERRE
jgi:hypothetical protein